MSLHILIAEDEESMCRSIGAVLSAIHRKFPDARIEVAMTLAEARRVIQTEPPPDVTLLDLTFPDSTWLDTIDGIDALEERTRVIIISGKSEAEIREYMKRPEIEVITKRPGFFDLLLPAIVRAFARVRSDEQHVNQNLAKLRELIDANAGTQ